MLMQIICQWCWKYLVVWLLHCRASNNISHRHNNSATVDHNVETSHDFVICWNWHHKANAWLYAVDYFWYPYSFCQWLHTHMLFFSLKTYLVNHASIFLVLSDVGNSYRLLWFLCKMRYYTYCIGSISMVSGRIPTEKSCQYLTFVLFFYRDVPNIRFICVFGWIIATIRIFVLVWK